MRKPIVKPRSTARANRVTRPTSYADRYARKWQRMAQQMLDCKDLAAEIARVKERAGRLGLLRTMHALEVPLTIVGFEIAGWNDKADAYMKLRFKEDA